MKIIFLDIDGVLNVYSEGRDEFGGLFHKHLEDNLGYIIKQTGAKIVITSNWRKNGLSQMQKMWKKRNLPGVVVGVTPTGYQLVKLGLFDDRDDVCRSDEIQYYLDNNDVENYVIIDDDKVANDSMQNNFVWCAENEDHEDCVDIGYGLTRKCAEKAIEILNRV